MKYYQLKITKTSKQMGNKDWDYQIYENETKDFDSIAEAKKYLSDTYGKCQKEKQYIDGKDGATKQTGWVYGFKSGWGGIHYFERHWVTLTEINATVII